MNNAEKTILFVSSIKRDDLCCIAAFINPQEKHDPSAKSDFHWQILKCRQIIFSHKEVIASPSHDNQVQIQVIMKKQFYETGKIQDLLQKLKMPGHRYQQLTNAIYESCLRYTIIAHIAPQWNQVQSFLVQGRAFLEAKEPLNSIKLELEVKDESMYVVLSPARVSTRGLTLDDLNISPALSQKFNSHPSTSIHDITIGAKWVHVLPSMKRGRIITISREIPNSCPYSTYKDLKRHWKNSYGYRLPESDAEVFYCTLSFHPMIPTKYTYPSICLKAAPLQFMGRPDQRAVISAFLSDLAIKMPYVCGHPFKVDGEQGYALPKSLEQFKENIYPSATPLDQHTGLLPKPIKSSVLSGILSSRNMNPCHTNDIDLFATQSSCGISLATPRTDVIGKTPFNSIQNSILQLSSNNHTTPKSYVAAEILESPIQKSISRNVCAIVASKQQNFSNMNNRMPSEQISYFDNQKQTPGNSTSSISATMYSATSQRSAGPAHTLQRSQSYTQSAFQTNASQTAATPGNYRKQFIESAEAGIPAKCPYAVGNIATEFPSHPVPSKTQLMMHQEPELKKQTLKSSGPLNPPAKTASLLPATTVNKYKPVFAPPAVSSFQSSQIGKAKAKEPSARAGNTSLPVIQGAGGLRPTAFKDQPSSKIPKAPTFGAQITPQLLNSVIPKVPTQSTQISSKSASSGIPQVPRFGNQMMTSKLAGNATPKAPAFGVQLTARSLSSVIPKAPTFGSSMTTIGIPKIKGPPSTNSVNKRSAANLLCQGVEVPSSGGKKPRSRPQIQSDINIEAMAQSQGLEKVNTATLLHWLQEKCVPCTTRDNKVTLINKVKNHLGIKE